MKKFYTLFILAFVAIAVNAQVSIKNPGILTGKQNLELNLTPIAREANVAQDQSSRRAGTLVTPPSGKEQLSYTLDGVYYNYSSSAGGFVQVSDAAPAEAKVVFDKMNANASLVNDAYESIKPNILIINEETEKHKDEFGLKLNINKPKK